MEIRRRTFRERYGEKECNKSENGETIWCCFCGAIARKSIVKINGEIIFSCFDCIPDYCDFPWIKSIEKI